MKVSNKLQEILENILPIRAYQRETKTLEELKTLLDQGEKSQIRTEILNPLILAPLTSLFRLGIVSILLVGFSEFYAGNLGIIALLNFIIASCIVYDPLMGALTYILEFIFIGEPSKRIDELMNIDVMTGEKKEVKNFDYEFKNVSFSYDGEHDVIKDISFVAKQNEVTAFVGPSGCGKSTLANLMLRFYDVDSGEINLGGEDIKSWDPEDLLKNCSMVFQNVILFNNTVMENIRIGKKDATDDEVIEAAKIAQAHEFIEKLPDGYNTVIGEEGSLLSGGEQQRLSIARAFLKDASIIFLDESTSSVDADSESKIQKAISKLIKDKTVIVIAHRLRTVMNANKIIVLENGKIVEEGNAKELLEKNGLFKKLADLQHN